MLLGASLDPDDADTLPVRDELDRLLNQAQPEKGDLAAEQLIAQLEAKKPGWPWWVGPLVCAALALIAVGSALCRDAICVFFESQDASTAPDWRVLSLIDPKPVYLPGGEPREEWLTRLRQAFERHPESVAAYRFYVQIYVLFQEELPPDFEEVTARLEPDNAIWPLLKSQMFIRQALDKRVSRAEPEEALLAKALAAYREAVTKPRLDQHAEEFERLWRAELHPASLLEAEAISPLAGTTEHILLHLDVSYDPLPALDAGKTDPRKLQALIPLTAQLLARDALSGGEVSISQVSQLERHLEELPGTAGLAEERARLQRFCAALADQTEAMALPWQRFGQERRDEALGFDLQPSACAATLKYALAIGAVLCLLAGAVAWLRLLPFPRIPAKVGRCVAALKWQGGSVRPALRVLIPIPVVAWLIVGILTSCFQFEGFPGFLIDFTGLVAVLMVLGLCRLLQRLRTKMARSLGAAGMRPPQWRLVIGWLQILLIALAIAFGAASLLVEKFWIFAMIPCSVVSLSWLGRLLSGYLNRQDGIRHRLLARSLAGALSITACVMAAGSLTASAVEMHLVRQAWANAPEPRTARESREELQKLIEEWKDSNGG
jgi:hypothetical protein